MNKGEIFTKVNIKKIRPGYGLSPVYYEKILGKKCDHDIQANEPLTKKLVQGLNLKIK